MRPLVRNLEAQHIAQDYIARAGLPLPLLVGHEVPAHPPFLRAVARAYDALESDARHLIPGGEGAWVARCYQAFVRECAAQRRFAERTMGVRFIPWQREDAPPYAASQDLLDDLARHNRLYVYTGGAPHPLLAPEENWTFRCIHDLFAHAAGGYPFSPQGEVNAYIHHCFLFTPLARRALATETLGQGAWVNFFGDHAAMTPAERPYAPQKADLLPERMTNFLALLRGEFYCGPFADVGEE